jgi:opacity protein-like surface antigen
MRVTALFVLSLLSLATGAFAQDSRASVGGTISASQTWDDEGSLGKGLGAGGRVDWRLFGNTSVEGSVDLLTHDRSGGFFQSEDTSTLVGASLVQRFGHQAVQPYVLGGVGLVHHSGTTQFQDLVSRRTSTDRAFHFGGGLAVKINERFEIGPEARFYVINAGNGSDPAWASRIGGRVGMRF